MGAKKRLFAGVVLALLVFPVLTCIPGPPENEGFNADDFIKYTDVVYSSDGKSLTLYLEGGVPVTNAQTRGLSKELAIAGHDYFEVVFYHPARTARTSWELYREAHIKDVYGKGAGEGSINYDAFSLTGLAAGRGAAILFVGKKVDRTLLAVGKLYSVTNRDIGTGALTTTVGGSITANTVSVTFEVSALKSGVSGSTDTGTGFYTDYSFTGPRDAVNGNVTNFKNSLTHPDDPTNTTLRATFMIDGEPFPMYKLLQSSSTQTFAHYHFALDGGGLINDFGIILAGNGEYGKKQPRYPTMNGQFQYASLRLDDKTIITAVNNTVSSSYNPVAAPANFQSPVKVKFNTANVTAQGSAFAFVFEIPVYALTAAVSTGNVEPGTWYIRASYDSYWLDLDTGPGSAGGAVLLGIGNPEVSADYEIRVIVPPLKWKYNNKTIVAADYATGRDFNVDGLVIWLEHNGVVERKLNEYGRTYEPGLTYELGMAAIRPNSGPVLTAPPTRDGEAVKSTLYGLQTVTVKYVEPGSNKTCVDYFYIICDDDTNPTRFTDMPDTNNNNTTHFFTATANTNSITNIQNYINGHTHGEKQGTYVIVLTASVDINELNINDQANPSLIILVASNSGVVIGKENGRSGIKCYKTTSGFYFGKWPFNSSLTVGGTGTRYDHTETYVGNPSATPAVANITYAHATYPYRINLNRRANDTPVTYELPFIKLNLTDDDSARVYDVTVDKNVTLVPDNLLMLY